MAQESNVMEKKTLLAPIALTAQMGTGGKIVVIGDKSPKNLNKGSGSHVFHFTLTDNSGHNVCFAAAPDFLGIDESNTPPSQPGVHTDQVQPDSVLRPSLHKAQFTDSNKRACTLAYSLFFVSDGPAVEPFDPIIINGGN